jgi:hypothetical protein
MSELFILYRDVKVTAEYRGKGINPLWEEQVPRGHFYIHIEGPKGKDVFDYWVGETVIALNQQSELSTALWHLMADAESGSSYDFEEFCSEPGYDTDSIRHKDIFNSCAEIAEKLRNVSKEFDFGADREFLDEQHNFHNNRVYATSWDLWCRPYEAVILFDDKEIEATWEENRPHPEGPSTVNLGDGWVDVEHRMPFENSDVYWTWLFAESKQDPAERYNITVPTVQLINQLLLSEDDDNYYLTL